MKIRSPRKGVLAALVIAALILTAELGLRIAYPDLFEPTFFRIANEGRTKNTESREMFWVPANNFTEEEARIRAYEGNALVYSLGGSISYGYPKNFGFNEILERKARSLCPEIKIIKLSLGGYTTYHAVRLFDRFLAVRTPALAILCNGVNDNTWGAVPYSRVRELNYHWSRSVLYQLNKVRLFVMYKRLLRKLMGKVEARPTRPVSPVVPPDDYRENAGRIVRSAREAGVPLVLVTQSVPTLEGEQGLVPYFEILEQLARENPGVFLADVRPAFNAKRREMGVAYLSQLQAKSLADPRDYGDPLFSDACCHPSDAGYGIYAEVIYAAIRENGLL